MNKKIIIGIIIGVILCILIGILVYTSIQNRAKQKAFSDILYTDTQLNLSPAEQKRLGEVLYTDSTSQKSVVSSTTNLRIYTE